MKTLTTLLTLSLLVFSSASFANVDGNRPDKKSNVAAPFVWGDASEAQGELSLNKNC